METQCKREYQCGGDCWLNVAGDFNVWDIVSQKCNGTIEQRELISQAFHNKIPKSEIIEKFKIEEKDKLIVLGWWY